jgi:hypothetical protein
VSTDSTATDHLTAYGKASLEASESYGLFPTHVGVVAYFDKLAACLNVFLIILRPELSTRISKPAHGTVESL